MLLFAKKTFKSLIRKVFKLEIWDLRRRSGTITYPKYDSYDYNNKNHHIIQTSKHNHGARPLPIPPWYKPRASSSGSIQVLAATCLWIKNFVSRRVHPRHSSFTRRWCYGSDLFWSRECDVCNPFTFALYREVAAGGTVILLVAARGRSSHNFSWVSTISNVGPHNFG
jgi:GTP cyclohydrolase II